MNRCQIEQLDTDKSEIAKPRKNLYVDASLEDVIRLVQEIERIRYEIKLLDSRATNILLYNKKRSSQDSNLEPPDS